MIIDVKPVMSEYHTCIDAVFVTMASFFKSDYELMYIGSWGFEYRSNKNYDVTFGEKLFSGFKRRSRDAIFRYHGIIVNWNTADTFDKLIEVINLNLSNDIPIGVFIDSYYCPWNPAYSKFHIDHYCLAIDFDKENNELICIDAYFSENLYKLPIENLRQGYKDYISFSKIEGFNNPFSLKEILQDNFFSLEYRKHHEDTYNNMILFADEIIISLDINSEVQKYNGDIQNSLLFRQINILGKYRIKFAISLRYLAIQYQQQSLDDIADEMVVIGEQWKTVNILFFKLLFKKNELIKHKISMLIKNLANKELEVAYKLIDICEKL